MKLMRLALTGSLLLVLAACGNDSPVNPPTNPNPPTDPGMPANPPGGLPGGIPGLPGGGVPTTPTPPTTPGTNSISGTVSTPSGSSAVGATRVIACYLTGNQQNPCDLTSSLGVEFGAGSSFPYTINGLSSGQYAVIATSDADGNGNFNDAVDFVGLYPSLSSPQPVTPPATGIDITMQASSDIATPNPTPTPGDLTGTWTGTTTTTAYGVEQTTFEFTQSGSNVSGTLTLVGNVPADPNNPITGTVNGSAVTISASYKPTEDGVETGDTLEYRYEGTLSGMTLAGTVTLLTNNTATETGQFSVTQSSTATAPLGKLDAKMLSRVFENIR